MEYVSIKPIPDYPWDMSVSYAKHWEQRWSGLDVGHRGAGNSFKFEMKKYDKKRRAGWMKKRLYLLFRAE